MSSLAFYLRKSAVIYVTVLCSYFSVGFVRLPDKAKIEGQGQSILIALKGCISSFSGF